MFSIKKNSKPQPKGCWVYKSVAYVADWEGHAPLELVLKLIYDDDELRAMLNTYLGKLTENRCRTLADVILSEVDPKKILCSR